MILSVSVLAQCGITDNCLVLFPPPQSYESNGQLGAQVFLPLARDCQIQDLHRRLAGRTGAETKDLRRTKQCPCSRKRQRCRVRVDSDLKGASEGSLAGLWKFCLLWDTQEWILTFVFFFFVWGGNGDDMYVLQTAIILSSFHLSS